MMLLLLLLILIISSIVIIGWWDDIFNTIQMYILNTSLLPNTIGTTNFIFHRTHPRGYVKCTIGYIFLLNFNRGVCTA